VNCNYFSYRFNSDKAARNKRSEHKLEKRVVDIKNQFNLIKDESVSYGDDDWIELRLTEDSDKYEQQLGINKN
jgi:hypothetical protein